MKRNCFVVISRGMQNGRDEDTVLRALAERLQAPPETLRMFLNSTPQRIEVVDDELTAKELCQEIQDIGLNCAIHAEDSANTANTESSVTSKAPNPDDTTGRTKGVYEMLWDCEYCGTRKLLGLTHRFCPTCASPQNSDKRYFPSEAERVAVKDHVFYGVDRVCSACSTPSSAKAEFCSQCGYPLTDAAKAKLHGIEGNRATGATATPPSAASGRGKKKLTKTLLGGAGVTAAGVLTAVFWTQQLGVTLSGHSWTREIRIEDFRPRPRSEWCDQMPGDAYDVSARQEVRSYDQVPDGETCTSENVDQGDGSYRVVERCRPKYRKVPVYDDMCAYTVDRWEYKRSVSAEGKDKNPYWPEVTLTQSGDCIGCERDGARSQSYLVHLQGPEDRYSCQLDESRWRETTLNSQWQLEVGAVAGEPRCGSLRPAEQ